MEIGGFFCFEQLPTKENHYLTSLGGDDLRYLMSGRCAIYYALQDLMLTDTKRVAYLPAYTCETVIGSFEKAGYTLYYYDVDATLTPQFDPAYQDQISVLSLCGYYGFSTYDRQFVADCAAKGICIIEDITHSAFSDDGIDPHCDYVVGSLRKWIGVPAGGVAIKCHGQFTLPVAPPDTTHLTARATAMHMKEQALAEQQTAVIKEASDMFWNAEMTLRQMFDAQGSDQTSIDIINHYPFDAMIATRRANYHYLLEHFPDTPQLSIVFPVLTAGTCPSHFSVYAADRTAVQAFLNDQQIHTTAYWPVPPTLSVADYPQAQYIYDHIFSIPCDQRYTVHDMQRICDVLAQLPQ